MDLEVLDIYGIGMGLRYLNKQQYKSKFGGIITIMISILIITQIIYTSQELFEKKNPEVITAERYVQMPERFNMKRNTFNMAFGAQYPETFVHFIDETVYKPQVDLIKMTKKLNVTTNEYYQEWKTFSVQFHPCTKKDFEVQESIEYFNSLPGIDDMYCLDYDSQELYIEGNFDQNQYAYIQIQLKLCEGPKCKDKDKIQKILTNSFVALYSNDVVINPRDYEPFQTVSRDFFWNTSPVISKEVQMYFRNVYVESDKGIFFEDKVLERSTSYSYQNEQVLFQLNQQIL